MPLPDAFGTRKLGIAQKGNPFVGREGLARCRNRLHAVIGCPKALAGTVVHDCAKPGDELSPSHSITSSARPSSGSGIVRPSAFAVFILMMSSTLVACWT